MSLVQTGHNDQGTYHSDRLLPMRAILVKRAIFIICSNVVVYHLSLHSGPRNIHKFISQETPKLANLRICST